MTKPTSTTLVVNAPVLASGVFLKNSLAIEKAKNVVSSIEWQKPTTKQKIALAIAKQKVLIEEAKGLPEVLKEAYELKLLRMQNGTLSMYKKAVKAEAKATLWVEIEKQSKIFSTPYDERILNAEKMGWVNFCKKSTTPASE